MSWRHSATTILAVLTATLTLGTPAHATAPTQEYGSAAGTAFVADCGTFDLYDDYVLEWNSTLHFDRSGTPVRIVSHVWGTDTFRNSETGQSVTGTIKLR